MQSTSNQPPDKLDHLVYTASTLKLGMDNIEKILGVRPVPGGHHAEFGTHNAMLSLGPDRYLEVISPDPSRIPSETLLFRQYYNELPGLARWVLRSENIEKTANEALKGGLDLGSVNNGKRETLEGAILIWKLTDPSIAPLDGAVPFLINWENTPHPAASLPSGGRLVGFRIEHPNPVKVKDLLDLLGVSPEVTRAKGVRIVATIDTSGGLVELY